MVLYLVILKKKHKIYSNNKCNNISNKKLRLKKNLEFISLNHFLNQ